MFRWGFMVGIKYLIKLHGNVLILSHKEFFSIWHILILWKRQISEHASNDTNNRWQLRISLLLELRKRKKKNFLFIAWCKKNKINNQVFFQKYICGHDKDGSIHSLVYLFHRCVNWEMLVKSQHVDNPTQICHNVLKLNLVFRDVWKYTFQNALRSFFSFWHLY